MAVAHIIMFKEIKYSQINLYGNGKKTKSTHAIKEPVQPINPTCQTHENPLTPLHTIHRPAHFGSGSHTNNCNRISGNSSCYRR